MKTNWYNLSRNWFDFAFENPDKVNCNHTALYFYIVDKWNRFWQKERFWLPTLFTMESLWIKSKNTYSKIFNDLVNFWFIKIIQKSLNQNTSTIITINSAISKNKSALDTALIQHVGQQEDSTVPIDKQRNKETNNIYIEISDIIEKRNYAYDTQYKITKALIDIYTIKRKQYSYDDIVLGFKNYFDKVNDCEKKECGRKKKYLLHPLKFLKQSNGFVSYI